MGILLENSGKLADLVYNLENSDIKNEVKTVIEGLNFSPQDLEKYAMFDHPKNESYGRNMVASGTGYEVLVLSWNPGDCSGIHSHGKTIWGTLEVFGNFDYYIFSEKEFELDLELEEKFSPGDIFETEREAIHVLHNSSNRKNFSLHVYTEPKKNFESKSKLYFPIISCIQNLKGGAFLSAEPNPTIETEVGPKGTNAVASLLDRLLKAGPSRFLK